jgi:hypothetical protein
MTVDEVYNYYDKNWSKMTRDLGLGASTYRVWIKRGVVPYRIQLVIQDRTNNKLIATRKRTIK